VDTSTPDQLPPPPVIPVLDVTSPARGSFQDGPVTVAGEVTWGTGKPTALTVNGADVPLGDVGSFSVDIDPDPGMLILGTRVEDDLGERAVDGRAMQVGPTHRPGAMLTDAIALQIGPSMPDDGTPTLDDIAGVTEAILDEPSFTDSLVGVTLPGTFDITVDSLSTGGASVDSSPHQGVLWLDTTLADVQSTFHTSVVGIDVDVWATASDATIQMDLEVGTGDADVTVQASDVTATLDGFQWGADYVPDWAAKALRDSVRGMVEDSLQEQARDKVASLVSDTLSSFAVDTAFGENDALHVQMKVSRARVTPQGLILWMDAAVSAQQPGIDLPSGAGSLATPGGPPALPIATDQPLVVLADDDFVNQVLFAFWHGGALGGWRLDQGQLAAMVGEDLPPPLGPVDHATMDVGLPPILSAPPGDMDVALSVGELKIGIVRTDGVPITVSLNARSGANLTFVPGGLSTQLDNRPAQMDIQAGMLQWPDALDPGDLASLFRLSAPALLGHSQDLLPAFPAPDLPVGALVDVPSVHDLVWGLDDATVSVQPSGWIQLSGHMTPR